MTITDADRKRLARIKGTALYGATFADLSWLVHFAEKLLAERDKASSQKPGSQKPAARS